MMVVAKGLLATVSGWFRWLLDDYHTRVVAALVEAQVGAGSVPGRLHAQFLRLA